MKLANSGPLIASDTYFTQSDVSFRRLLSLGRPGISRPDFLGRNGRNVVAQLAQAPTQPCQTHAQPGGVDTHTPSGFDRGMAPQSQDNQLAILRGKLR